MPKKTNKPVTTPAQRFLKELEVFSDAIGKVPLDFLGDEELDETGQLAELVDLCQTFTSDASSLMEKIIKGNKLKPRKGQFWFL